jgi:putative spermidine/putrescine transport system permease protein
MASTSIRSPDPPGFRLRSSLSVPISAIAPAALILAALFIAPLFGLLMESFREFTPGRVGAALDAPFTFANYADLATTAFAGVVFETLWISAIASAIGVGLALPLAHLIIRRLSGRWRATVVGLLILLVLLSMLVRTYALELTFGSVGVARPLVHWLGVSPTSRGYIDALVAAGLIHAITPIATLTLLGSVQNVDPRLADAAQSLGAPRWRAHLDVTLPLNLPGVMTAFIIAFSFSISAFVIPLVLGSGRVNFVSNLVFTRFSDVANYPSGAAISVFMLALALALVLGLSRLRAARGPLT